MTLLDLVAEKIFFQRNIFGHYHRHPYIESTEAFRYAIVDILRIISEGSFYYRTLIQGCKLVHIQQLSLLELVILT